MIKRVSVCIQEGHEVEEMYIPLVAYIVKELTQIAQIRVMIW